MGQQVPKEGEMPAETERKQTEELRKMIQKDIEERRQLTRKLMRKLN